MPDNLTDIKITEVKIYEIKKHFGDDDTKELNANDDLYLFGFRWESLESFYTDTVSDFLCKEFDAGEIDQDEFEEAGGESLRFENWASEYIVGFNRELHNKKTLIFWCYGKSDAIYRINLWESISECEHNGGDQHAQFEILVKFTDQDGVFHSNF